MGCFAAPFTFWRSKPPFAFGAEDFRGKSFVVADAVGSFLGSESNDFSAGFDDFDILRSVFVLRAFRSWAAIASASHAFFPPPPPPPDAGRLLCHSAAP